MRRLVVALTTVVLFASCKSGGGAELRTPMPDLSPAPAGVLTAALVASTSGEAVKAQSNALGAFVKQATGHDVRAVVFPDYDSLAAAIAKGQVDAALMPPLAYVRAQGQGKLQPLGKVVRGGQGTYRSVLFAKADTALKGVEELKKAKDLKAAWVDSSSATGYIFPKALLISSGINPQGLFLSQDFLGNHDAVCKAVSEGQADIGATFSDDPATGPATHATGCRGALGDKADALHIIAATGNIPNDVLAVRDGIPEDVKSALNKAVNELSANEEGKAVLKNAFNADGFTTVSDEDFAPVHEALGAFKQ